MSVPDHELDEPTIRYCEEHLFGIPCPVCRMEEIERQHDERKEHEP